MILLHSHLAPPLHNSVQLKVEAATDVGYQPDAHCVIMIQLAADLAFPPTYLSAVNFTNLHQNPTYLLTIVQTSQMIRYQRYGYLFSSITPGYRLSATFAPLRVLPQQQHISEHVKTKSTACQMS